MTLYDIDERILSLIDPETGEVAEAEEFDRLQMERTEKLEGVALAFKEYTAQAAMLAEQEKSFADRKRRAESKAAYYKMLLERGTNGEKFSTPLVEISFRKSTEVVVDNILEVPFNYTMADIKPNKVAIKDALKRGEIIPGARLAEKKNIQIK